MNTSISSSINPKLIFLVGLPGSGKSHFAKDLAKKENAVIVSTDEVRRDLFGEETKQKKTRIVFKEVYTRIEKHLSLNQNVIFDATNIDRDKRMKAMSYFPKTTKICYYLDTPYEVCLKQNKSRKRKVDVFIIDKIRKHLHFPTFGEGFDDIHIIHHNKPYSVFKDEFINLMLSSPSYEDLFTNLKSLDFVSDMIDFNQENPFHSFTLCKHTYLVFDYLNEYYTEDDKLLLLIVALFHDTGKPFCKVYKKTRGYYSYFGHENVSAQIACHFLKEIGFDDEFVMKAVNLIQMHMKITHGGDEGASEIYHLLDNDYLWKLYMFSEADTFAK